MVLKEFLGQGHAIDCIISVPHGEASWHIFRSQRRRILDAYLKCAELSAHITVLASRQGPPISGPMHIIRPHLPPHWHYIFPRSPEPGPQSPVSTLWSPQRKFLLGTNQPLPTSMAESQPRINFHRVMFPKFVHSPS